MGVFETLKGISKQTLRALRSRMTGDIRRPTVIAAPATPSGTVAAATPAAGPSPLRGLSRRPPTRRPRTPPPSSATLERLANFAEIAQQGA
jgi:hypothetical protein